MRSANEVDELRYRTDKEGRVVFHDRVDIISPIAVPGKTFYTVRIPYYEDFERFYAEAYALITNMPEDGDPYGAEKILAEQGDYDVVHLSAIYVNHAFVDGSHLTSFFGKVEEYLKEISHKWITPNK